VIALFTLIFAPGAFAHTSGAQGAGFYQGFIHPLLGLDHLLAMLAVGIWAAQTGARWLIPAAFLAMLALGGGMAMLGWPLPQVELGIAGSVVVFGLFIAGAAKMPPWLSMSVVGLFALFHGHAHGAEMPQAAAPWLYASGLLLTSAMLHGLGMLIGFAHHYSWPARLLRLGGVSLAAAGVWLLAGL
ncbi:MAG: HupE/UreJ family protein, partial [Gammaproteobacteria bacterium]